MEMTAGLKGNLLIWPWPTGSSVETTAELEVTFLSGTPRSLIIRGQSFSLKRRLPIGEIYPNQSKLIKG